MATAAQGRAARGAVPRSSHALWEPAADRDPVATLVAQERTRTAQLLPIRHGRMLRSPFAFFRGAAAIMAADLAHTPVTGIRVQCCGDAHLANFGAYAAPDRSLVFDLNDFDESLPGPWEWDVKRLAASIAVCARDQGFAGAAAVRAAVGAYREAMRRFARMRAIEVWYTRLDVGRFRGFLDEGDHPNFDRVLAKARRKDSVRALAKLTYVVDGVPRIVSDPPLVTPIAELFGDAEEARVRAAIERYLRDYARTLQSDRRRLLARYTFADAAHKVVGVGSVGMRAWIALLLGRDSGDPLFLQFKEAGPSVLEPFAGRSRIRNSGRRVVEGQRLMQAASDSFLGWLADADDGSGEPRDFYVRQLWDSKGSVALEALNARQLVTYSEVCGWTLARAHARSGDGAAIAGYLGTSDTFDRALADFAAVYADQNARDHAALADAVAGGRLEAVVDR